MKYYDNTRISDYKTCPRKYLIRHEYHLRKDGTALPLVFGLAWHEAMDVVWKLCSENHDMPVETIVKAAMVRWRERWIEEGLDFNPDLELQEKYAPRTPMIATEMLFNYVMARREFIQEVELLAIEQPFAVKLYATDKPVRYIGRLDKVVKHPQHGILVIEHKTSSSYAKAGGFRSDYIASWSPNSQIDGYSHACFMLYGECAGVWIDAALVHKTVHNVFKFIPIERQFAALDQWLYETRDWIERIESESKPNAEGQVYNGFPKNTGSCSMYAGCTYRDLCKFNHQPSDILDSHDGFIVDKWEPFNILEIDKLGLPDEQEK